jgi:hypothetical protein
VSDCVYLVMSWSGQLSYSPYPAKCIRLGTGLDVKRPFVLLAGLFTFAPEVYDEQAPTVRKLLAQQRRSGRRVTFGPRSNK